MKISIYTYVKNGIYQDFHVVEMLKHHLPLADEIIVHEGLSTDGTYEAISGIDPKIRIFRTKWEVPSDVYYYIALKEPARKRCTGDWVIMLDADEFIPEWEFDRLRNFLCETRHPIVRLNFTNFYGNFRVYHKDPWKVSWPAFKHAIHRNIGDIELWGDGSNVRIRGVDSPSVVAEESFALHHFGFVRDPARLRQKWRKQQGIRRWLSGLKPRKDWMPGFMFDMFPYKWNDPQFVDDLAIYDGPHIRAVRDNPGEFVRDNFSMYDYLRSNVP